MDIYTISVIVSYYIISILVVWEELVFIKNKKKNKSNTSEMAKNTEDNIPINTITLLTLNCIFFLVTPLNFIFGFLPKLIEWSPSYFFLGLGVCISLSGILVRLSSTLTLAEAHSIRIRTQKNQVLYQEGLYKFIRHPIYLGLLLTVGGLALMFQDVFMLAVGLFTYFCVIFIRFSSEEKLLINHFGDIYLSYMKKTKAIIPFIY
jgi:protein-S-isoprenylcysteine O-methyltransferase Ste14